MPNMTNPAIGLSVSQRRALSVMGIEVWVRRTPPSAADELVAPNATDAPSAPTASSIPTRPRSKSLPANEAPTAKAPAVSQTPPSASASETDYRAELDCLASAGIVIVGRWQNALDRRLANDIAFALGSAVANDLGGAQSANAQAKVQQTAFRWPSTQTGDASFAAARSAFKAFARGQTERAQARCLVLFGDVAAALAVDMESAVAAPVVRQPSIGALRADPNAKKALWLNVSQNVLG
jgi:hypothetical protein